jgi:hypothetical protein
LKPKRSEILKKESEKIKHLDNSSYDSLNRIKSLNREKKSNILPSQRANLGLDNDSTGLNSNRKLKPVSRNNTYVNEKSGNIFFLNSID